MKGFSQKKTACSTKESHPTKQSGPNSKRKKQKAKFYAHVRERHSITDPVEKTKQALQAFVGSVAQAPTHLVDNEYITWGYRVNHNSFSSLLRSLFSLHNESVNVWSHLLGALLFACLIIYLSVSISSMKSHSHSLLDELSSSRSPNGTSVDSFQSYLSVIQQDLDLLKNYTTRDTMREIDEDEGDVALAADSEMLLEQAVHKLDAFAHAVIYEFWSLKHFIEEQEVEIQEKVARWRAAAAEVQDQLQQSIRHLQEVVIDQYQNASFHFERLEYMQKKMQNFRSKVNAFSSSLISDSMSLFSFPDPHDLADHVSRWPLFVHMATACLCLGFSTTFHLFSAHSHFVAKFLVRLDYSGIIFLIFGSSMPLINYHFSCGPSLFYKNLMISVMAVSSLVTFIVVMMPSFDRPESRKWRGLLFIVLGAAAAANLFIINFLVDPAYTIDLRSEDYLIGAAVYVVGTSLYVARAPERCRPGSFNVCGMSHNLFHICVVIACFLHYQAGLSLYFRRRQFHCPAL